MYHPNVFTRCFLSLPLTLPVFPHMSHFPFVLHTPPRHFPFLVQAASRALGDFYQLICRFRTLTAPTATRSPPQGGDTTPGGVRSAPPPHGGDTPQPPSLSTDRGGEGAVDTSAGGGWGDSPPDEPPLRLPGSELLSRRKWLQERESGLRSAHAEHPGAFGGGDPRDPLSLDPARGGGRGGAPTPREPRPCLLPPPQVKCTLSWFV